MFTILRLKVIKVDICLVFFFFSRKELLSDISPDSESETVAGAWEGLDGLVKAGKQQVKKIPTANIQGHLNIVLQILENRVTQSQLDTRDQDHTIQTRY